MIMLICNEFEETDFYSIPTGRYELLVDYAVDLDTGRNVCMPNIHPSQVGGKFNNDIGEWVIE